MSSDFFSELKRRNVLRAAALYIGGIWALSQGLAQLFPVFGVPESIVRWIVVAAVIGFPFWIAFAWFYELTPSGLKRESEIDPADSVAHRTGKKLDRWIIAVLAAAVVLLLADRFVPHQNGRAAASALEKSIAVLPFENLSADKDNAYFAEGIQDEILTGLSRIGALKVISRTSTRSYASRPDNIAEIAQQLGVATILEGSVQKAGKRVRVNVQLIDAASDNHLWAETYDRSLDDVFAVQSEVAQKIASSLRATLTQDERATLTARPTNNPAAYDAYLRGRALNVRGGELDINRKVANAYAEAVRLDPDFALAWAQLAKATSYLYRNGVDPKIYTADYVKQAIDNALRLQPRLVETQIALGAYRYRVLGDLQGAALALQAALANSPNDPVALANLGYVERRQGKLGQAVQHLEQAAHRDPRNPGTLVAIGGETLIAMRRYDDARSWLDRALAVTPDSTQAIAYKAQSYAVQGRLADAKRILDPILLKAEDPQIAFVRSFCLLLEHRYDAVITELQLLLARPDSALNGWGPQLAINLGYAQRHAGKDAQARDTFQQLVTRIEPHAEKVDDTLQPIMLALAYAGLGRSARALAQAQRAVELYRSDALLRPKAEDALSQVRAMTGDHQAAIVGLARSLQVPAGITPAMLRLDPAWDPLRGDPRFKALVKRYVNAAPDGGETQHE